MPALGAAALAQIAPRRVVDPVPRRDRRPAAVTAPAV